MIDKLTQDQLWKCAPKAFRDHIKEMYQATQLKGLQQTEDVERADRYAEAMEAIFGEHNLTSDAELEEMAMCTRKDVLDLYQEALELIDRGDRNNYLNDKLIGIGQKNVLYTLFGSKCLPDEPLSQKTAEICDNENLI